MGNLGPWGFKVTGDEEETEDYWCCVKLRNVEERGCVQGSGEDYRFG